MTDTQEQQFDQLTIRIERQRCIGSGNCVKVAPQLFELDDSNIVAFRRDAQVADREQAIEACAVCPVDALIAIDADGEQSVPSP